MEQTSKGFPRKSIDGGLRYRGDGLYKEMTTIEMGHVI